MARAHRTYWRVRQQYRRAGLAGSIIGGFATAALFAPNVNGAEWISDGLPLPTVEGVLTFALAVALPPVLARLIWRLHRRRFFEDMYQITAR
jgi:hypothetical protein